MATEGQDRATTRAAVTPEVQVILSQVEIELTALTAANEVGTITIHCGADKLVLEVNRKLDPVQRKRQPKVPLPTSWK